MSQLLRRRNWILAGLLVIGVIALTLEALLAVPRVLEVWHPWDYGNYVEMGRLLRQGLNPYGTDRYYPLPTILWIFVPLSMLPAWFRIVWILFPFVFILILFRSQGILLFLFPPFWFATTDAMFDGWLLIPLWWLLQNRRYLAGLGAALLLFKPHVVLFTVLYMFFHWTVTRDWENLSVFVLMVSALWLPSFVVDPVWPLKMLAVLQTRVAGISVLPLLTVSLWSWWAVGGWGVLVFLVALLLAGVFFWKAMQNGTRRVASIQIASLLLNPIMLGANMIMVLPTLSRWSHIVAVVAAALGAYALDRAMGNFGGGYALVALIALYFQVRNQP